MSPQGAPPNMSPRSAPPAPNPQVTNGRHPVPSPGHPTGAKSRSASPKENGLASPSQEEVTQEQDGIEQDEEKDEMADGSGGVKESVPTENVNEKDQDRNRTDKREGEIEQGAQEPLGNGSSVDADGR